MKSSSGSTSRRSGSTTSRAKSQTREQLYKAAQRLKIDGRSNMTKDELIDALRNH